MAPNRLETKRINRRLRGDQRRKWSYGVLGDGKGAVEVPDRENYVYARVNDVVLQVYNNRTKNANNLPVIIGYDPMMPRLLQVLDIHSRDGVDTGGQYRLATHADTHKAGGLDPVYIYLSQILNWRAVVTGMSIQIYAGTMFGDTFHYVQRLSTWSMSGYKPGAGAKWVLIYVTRAGDFGALAGDTADTIKLCTPSLIPIPPFGAYPLWAVRVYASQTALSDTKDLFDLRWSGVPFNAAQGDITETIASGAITARSQFIRVYGESGAADDLETINGGAHGSIVTLCAPDAATAAITVKTGVGNIVLNADLTITDSTTTISLLYDDEQDKWIQVGGVSSTTGTVETVYWAWDPDAPPASPSAYDDEFDDDSFDTGLWTEYDHGSVQTITEGSQGAVFTFTGDGSASKTAGAYQAIPAGDFTIDAKISITGVWAIASGAGLAVFEDASSSSGNFYFIRMGPRSADNRLGVGYFTAWDTLNSEKASRLPLGIPSHAYFRIQRTSTTYRFSWSSDGVGWIQLLSTNAATMGFTPTHFGPLLLNSSSSAAFMTVRFFRYQASDTGQNAPISGRKMPITGNAFVQAVATKSGNYTITDADNYILGNAAGGEITITLPTAAGRTGRSFSIQKTDSSGNAVVLDGDGSETIDGATTRSLTVQYQGTMVVSDGANWHMIPNLGGSYVLQSGDTMSGLLTILRSDSATNTSYEALKLSHATTSTADAGLGASIGFEVEDDGGTMQDLGELQASWKVATSASRVGRHIWYLNNASGSVEVLRMSADSAGAIFNDSGADMDFRVESDTEANMFWLDASADAIYLGGSTNAVKIEKGGELSLIGDATVWDDLRVIPGSFDRPGISDPTIVAYDVNGGGVSTYLWQFAKNNIASFTVQLPHGYKQGEDISVHIHWTPGANGVTENGNTVGWKVQYSWANIDGNFGTMATADLSDACDGTNHKHQMTPGVTITGSGKNISSMLLCNVTRTDTGTDDTWSGTASGALPMLLEIDFHFPIDTIGSKTISAK